MLLKNLIWLKQVGCRGIYTIVTGFSGEFSRPNKNLYWNFDIEGSKFIFEPEALFSRRILNIHQTIYLKFDLLGRLT